MYLHLPYNVYIRLGPFKNTNKNVFHINNDQQSEASELDYETNILVHVCTLYDDITCYKQVR